MGRIIIERKSFLIMLIIFLGWRPTFGGSKSFDEIFKLEHTIRLEQTKNGGAKAIQAFRIGRNGRICISAGPPGESEVRIYTSKGEVMYVIQESDIGPIGGYAYTFFKAVDFDQNSHVYISESVSGKVAVIDTAGQFLSYFAPRHDHNCRAGASDMEINDKGYLYLGGPCYQEIDICPKTRDFCLHQYDSKGKYIKSFFPFEKRLFELTSIPSEKVYFDFDQEGNIWCVQHMVYQIFKYSPEGKLLQKFPGKSSLYKPPTKFSDSKSEQARRGWQTSWSKISNLITLEPNLILLSLITHSPSKCVVEIYDHDGNVLETDIQTNHRLLGKDYRGFVYFLLDGYEKDKWSDEFRIGKFSVRLTEQFKSETQ